MILHAQLSEREKAQCLTIEEKIDQIMPLLTLEEKVSLCHAQSKFSSPGVPRLGIPEIWMSDGPHGVRAEINWDNWGYAGWTNDSCTAFPALTCLAATFNPELAYHYGQALGEEARYRRKDILLGPGVNIYRTPLNGRNFEYMGEDPFLASTMVVPYVKGVQENSVSACVKHFALNNQETWRGHINVVVSDRALREIYLPAYRAAVEKGHVWAVMGAYNQFRGQHCCHNEILLNQILKQEWDFDGVVVTDWGGAHNTLEAANNGLDIEMGTLTDGLSSSESYAYDNYYLAKPFLNLLEQGKIDEKVLDDKVRRILRLMFRTNMDPCRPAGKLTSRDHFDLAREVAGEGIVLLKNEDGFFPIKDSKDMTIAVIGENAVRNMTSGGGSSELKPKYEITPLAGIREQFPEATILYSRGYASGPPAYGRVIPADLDADSLRNAAIELASRSDRVLFIGGLNKNYQQDCEGDDRVSFDLPFGQAELLQEITRVNKHTGVILISGNAVEMSWINQVPAVMQAWYLGSEAGHALADIISGKTNPSGKLPFTFPVHLTDNAAHHFGKQSYPGDSINEYYLEDILVGYRWHDTKKIPPRFEFGFGLSYTSFKIDHLTSDRKSYGLYDTIRVNCQVKNTGNRTGAEVVQVYVQDIKSSVLRPEKELKAFQKVRLEPGEEKLVSLKIPVTSLAFYDENEGNWVTEPGEFHIMAGSSSRRLIRPLNILVYSDHGSDP